MSKKITTALTLTLTLTLLLTGCKKYEEGPWISLRSPEKRIEGHWLIDKYYINNIDSTGIFFINNEWPVVEIYVTHPGDGDGNNHLAFFYSGTDNPIPIGIWEFSKDKKDIYLNFKSIYNLDSSSFGPFFLDLEISWKIVKLSYLQCNIESDIDDNTHILKFKKIKG